MNEHICLSGGADGADLQWGMCAGTIGHTVIHWSFSGHRSQAPDSETVVLTPEQMREADPFVKQANFSLGRKFPTSNSFTTNLLRRNWYQVRDAERIYAVSSFKDGQVQGGTAWAVQMFIDRFDGPCEAYVFDQITGQWFTWNGGLWVKIDQPQEPHGVWAGVGTRYLNLTGKNAIRKLMRYVPIGTQAIIQG